MKMTPAKTGSRRVAPVPSAGLQRRASGDQRRGVGARHAGTISRAPAWRGATSFLPRHLDQTCGRAGDLQSAGVTVTPATIAYLVAVFAVAVAMAELKARPAYRCPTCGARRADAHSPECPWREKR